MLLFAISLRFLMRIFPFFNFDNDNLQMTKNIRESTENGEVSTSNKASINFVGKDDPKSQ